MKIIKTSDVRANFQHVINMVHYTGQPIVIAKREKPWVIINPLPEDDPKYDAAIKKFLKEEEQKQKKKK